MNDKEIATFSMNGEKTRFETLAREAAASVCNFIKSQGKTLWNLVDDKNIDRDTLFAYAFIDGDNTLQEVRLCALKARDGGSCLDGLFLTPGSCVDAMTDQEVLALFDNPGEDFAVVNDLASSFAGRMTIVSLLDNLSTKYYTI